MTIDDKKLDQRLAALQRECDPPPEVWVQVSTQLPARGSRPAHRRWLAMAAVLCGLAVGLALLLGQAGLWQPDSAPGLVDQPAVPTTQEHHAEWQPALQRQAVFDTAWEENEAAIKALEQALAAEPGNLLLKEFMAEARLRQSKLIELALRIDKLEAPSGVQL